MRHPLGQLECSDYVRALHLFVNWWRQAWPQQQQQLYWSVESVVLPVTEQVMQYALLERIIAAADTTGCSSGAQTTSQSAALVEYNSTVAAEADDAAILQVIAPEQQQQQQQQEVHVHQYSIAYHDMYKVPVLYIRAFKQDGMLLNMTELLHDLPQLQQYKDEGQAEWTFITPTEHPLLHTACYMLHPCQTATRMQLLMQQASPTAAAAEHCSTAGATKGSCGTSAELEHVCDDAQLLLYMKAWFSLVAGLLGIPMTVFYDAPLTVVAAT